jgi:hypothetical protein
MLRKKLKESRDYVPGPFSLVCNKCGGRRSHEISYLNVMVQHLRCQNCRTVRVYLSAEEFEEDGCSATALDFETLRTQVGQKEAFPYRPEGRFADGDFIMHQTFGEGYVLLVYQPPVKMAVLFADKSRLLTCGSCFRSESGFTGIPVGDTPVVEVAAQPEAASGTEEADKGPEGDKATCPKCGRSVHPGKLNRSSDGKSTNGCTFCVLGSP